MAVRVQWNALATLLALAPQATVDRWPKRVVLQSEADWVRPAVAPPPAEEVVVLGPETADEVQFPRNLRVLDVAVELDMGAGAEAVKTRYYREITLQYKDGPLSRHVRLQCPVRIHRGHS